MEEIKAPKKERKFLKAIGNIGKVLAEELVMGIARKFIGKVVDKIGNKKQGLVIAFIVLASSFVFAQFPTNTNKQRLGFQTTADGLVWRGSISDTASIQPVSNQNAWVILDTVNLKIYSFDFTSNVWNQVGGGAFAQPIDSLFFNVNVPTNNVDTAKMRWDSELGTVVLGMYDQVPNELGFKNFWLVKNQTGSTITKGSIVYANGTVGSSGRITVAKFIANGTIDAKYLLGITAHDLSNGEDGYVISFGKIRQVNTDTFAAGAILYPSPTTAGVWTDVEPIAPNLDMPIGFCINSHVNNGTIAIRVASGYSLNELHNVAISSPVEKSSLYYSGGLWRDTTAALLVSDTTSMLTNYLRTGVAASTYTPLTRSISTTAPLQGGGDLSTNRTLSILSASDTQSGIVNLTAQLFSGSKVFKHRLTADSLFFLNNSSPIPTHVLGINTTGGVNSVGRFTLGNGLNITSGGLLQADTALLVTMFDTTSMLTPYLRKADTTAMLLPYFRDADTTSLNLTSRFAAKLNISDTSSMLTNYLRSNVASNTYLPLIGGTLTGDLRINKSSSSILRLSSADVSNYGKIIFNSNTPGFESNGASIESSGDGIGVDVGSLNFLTGFGTARTTRMTITPLGNISIVNSATIGGTLGVTGATTLTGGINGNTTFNNGNVNIGIITSAGISTSSPKLITMDETFGNNTVGTNFKLKLFQDNATSTYGFGISSGLFEIVSGNTGAIAFFTNGANERMRILSGGDVGIGTSSPNAKLDVRGSVIINEGSGDFDTRIESDGNANMVFVDASTDRVGIGTGTPSKTLDINGEVKIATVTATPTALLGKDASNVVGEVTTVAQTGLMTRGALETSTSSVEGTFSVAHGLGATPVSIIITSAGLESSFERKLLFEVYARNSDTFSVQAWNLDGSAATSKTVKIYWLAIK